MKYKSKKLLVLALSLASLAACGQNQNTADSQVAEESTLAKIEEEAPKPEDKPTEEVENTTQTEDIDQEEEKQADEKENPSQEGTDSTSLFEDFQAENTKVRQVKMESQLYNKNFEGESSSVFYSEAIYDDDRKIISADSKLEGEDGYFQEIIFYPDDPTKAQIIERQAGEEETTVTETDVNEFDIQPDYHRLVDGIVAMEDQLEVSEEGDTYKLELKEDAKNVLGLIAKEYRLNLDGLYEDDVSKIIEIEIDKDSKLLKKFHLSIEPLDEELKGNKIEANSYFTDHELAD